MTGFELSFKLHARIEFGAYVKTHEEHTNDMSQRTLGAICLGLTCNRQGGHWFMSLTTGGRITRHQWTPLPLPQDAVRRVVAIGHQQGMPSVITYANQHGHEICDGLDEIYDDESHMSEYSYHSNDEVTEDYDDHLSYDTSVGSSEHGPDYHPDANGIPLQVEALNHPHIGSAPMLVPMPDHIDDQQQPPNTIMQNHNDPPHDAPSPKAVEAVLIEIPVVGPEEMGHIPGVGIEEDEQIPGVEDDHAHETAIPQDEPETEAECFKQAKDSSGQRALDNDDGHPQRERQSTSDPAYEYIYAIIDDLDPTDAFALKMTDEMDDNITMITGQMSAKKGLRLFGQDGANAIKKELEQLVYRHVMYGKHPGQLTRKQQKSALKYLVFLKQKRCGRIKARGCADGRKQRIYKSKEGPSSTTISMESLFLTCVIDVMERRHVITCDNPGAFMQADMDELIHVKLEGELAELLIKVNSTYEDILKHEGNKPVIYAELDKALYGTLQAALLFWKKIQKFFIEKHGFKANRYNSCVVNKDIDGKQCTIGWPVDNIKISHCNPEIAESIVGLLDKEYEKEAPLVVTQGKVHEYLGMTIDFSEDG